MPIPFIAQLLIGVALNVVGYLLMPKPKTAAPDAVEDMEAPTAESGRPVPVLFGSMTIASPNSMGDWDTERVSR